MSTLSINNTVKIIRSKNPESLWEILKSDVVLVIWERSPISFIKPALQALLQTKHPLRIDFQSDDWATFEENLLQHLPFSESHIRSSIQALKLDIVNLASRFTAISGHQHLRVRFERVENDGCALFHVDTLPLRLVCTYSGPGTQWVEEEHVCRGQLGLRGRTLEEANLAIVPDPNSIRTCPAWHVLIFKGRLWKGHGYFDGLVHRSAPVRHPNDFRLRLTIDFAETCTC